MCTEQALRENDFFCGLCQTTDFPCLLSPMGCKVTRFQGNQMSRYSAKHGFRDTFLPSQESPSCCPCSSRGGRSTRLPQGDRSQAASQPWQCITNALNLTRRTQPPFRGPTLKVTLHTWSQTCQPQVSQQLWEDLVPYPKVLHRRHH